MDLINQIFASYPTGVDLQLSDFTYSLSLQNPDFAMTLTVLLITFLLGFLVYVYSFVLVVREKSAPYPLWMHTFYFAADFMGIWVFLDAWLKYDHFLLFLLLAIGEAIWVGMETYCLQRAMTYEKDINFKQFADAIIKNKNYAMKRYQQPYLVVE